MERVRNASRSVISGVEDKDIEHWVHIHIMGKTYRVPADLTIMQAIEFAGYRMVRSCGCRAGFCGACSTVYRREGEYKLRTAMACQTRVEDGMYLVQIPFSPAVKPHYDLAKEAYEASAIMAHFPDIARCVSCNTCTKSCPQDLQVMDYVQAALRGDFKAVAEGSFECIQCGLCAIRCPAEIVQYHMAQFVRRMYGRNGTPLETNLKKRIQELEERAFDEEFQRVMGLGEKDLREIYTEQQRSREVY
ncbi:MAG TPA: 4Fe-4S dicluster domain-containing protein [Candidatus Aminicenantes bacterium]|nr:4Fe-4S dicluster domain-containing protein [Candidatus Aminicenantes bacterium]HDT14386.1 4Fe-4S dicluster domain-containing protein [Candidatus Aminicenantes bacterium]